MNAHSFSRLPGGAQAAIGMTLGHVIDATPPDSEGDAGAYDPGSIAVNGAVSISFAIL